MEYRKPFAYFAGKPGTGWKNVLCGTLCLFVPVAGQMVWLGYRAEVSEELARDPHGERHPDFSTDRLMRYLERGVWPFIAMFIAQFPIALLAYGIGLVVGLVFYQFFPVEELAFLAGFAAIAIVATALGVLVWPIEIHAMKAQALQPAENLRFTRHFLGLVGPETVVAALVHGVLSVFVVLVGFLCCGVGMYPAAVIAEMAQQHLMAQLYQRYLDEGGEPIPPPPPKPDYRDDPDDDFDDEPDDRPRRPQARRLDPDRD